MLPPQPQRPSRAAALLALAVSMFLAGSVVAGAVGALGATSGPPPTPVPPSGSLSPFPTVLHTPQPGTDAPSIIARAAILESILTGQVLYRKHDADRRPIASLTKLMTALIAVDKRKLDHVVTVGGDATEQTGSTLGLAVGERISVLQLLYALLLQSSNDAATALADDVAGSTAAFVELMNERATALGMGDTRFLSPNGLDDRGYSSAADLANLTRVAFANPTLRAIMATKIHAIANPEGPTRIVQNRNALLWLYPGASGVKTGFTTPAGFCLIATAERDGRELVAVVLGDASDASFDDAATLLDHGFDAFVKRTVIHEAETLGSITVDGLEVDVTAGRTLVRLVRSDRVDEVRVELQAAPGLSLPLLAGQTVGRVVALAHGVELGAVRGVAAATVPPRHAPPPPQSPQPPPPRPFDVLMDLLQAMFGDIA